MCIGKDRHLTFSHENFRLPLLRFWLSFCHRVVRFGRGTQNLPT
jgi:hypothetical protein